MPNYNYRIFYKINVSLKIYQINNIAIGGLISFPINSYESSYEEENKLHTLKIVSAIQLLST